MKTVQEYNEQAVIIIALGLNDAFFIVNKNKNKISKNKFENNIRKFIRTSKKFTKNIICLGPSPCSQDKTPTFDKGDVVVKNEYIIQYNEILKSVSKEQKVMFIDIFNKLKKTKNFTSFDGLHLSSKGHQKIFEIVKNFLIKNKIIKRDK